jgi:3-deoxy-manno-octulosonate cytidylyltransferase (CMP-KDO synthetase)
VKTLVVIPARYKSSRFPGKPLVSILGKTMINRVWERCVVAVGNSSVYIATDDIRIAEHCFDNGMQYVMTKTDCLTGTDRVANACSIIEGDYDIIINVQGDEPLIEPNDILKIIDAYNENNNDTIYCGTCKINSEEDFNNPNIIKIITDKDKNLLYASRAGIPTNKKLGFEWAYKQVCIYAFPYKALCDFTKHTKTLLESIEDIEFLRFLELGYNIKMVGVSGSSIAVDVPEDVEKVKEVLLRG